MEQYIGTLSSSDGCFFLKNVDGDGGLEGFYLDRELGVFSEGICIYGRLPPWLFFLGI